MLDFFLPLKLLPVQEWIFVELGEGKFLERKVVVVMAVEIETNLSGDNTVDYDYEQRGHDWSMHRASSSFFEQLPPSRSLRRDLTVRQINMIAIAGTIGTGLFLGTGNVLASSGPLYMLLSYLMTGGVVFLTMMTLGEMSAFMPVSGSFAVYAKRFVSEGFGFTINMNYWLNDAVSVAGDLTALQIVVEYWHKGYAWVASLSVWILVLTLNLAHISFYGESEYWLSLVKVISITLFFIVGVSSNLGYNDEHEFLGFRYWFYKDAPFVNGFKGFLLAFISAAFAYGGTESISLTAGEQKNPVRTMPTVVKAVFWRVITFYVISVFLIGINIPYDYPKLSISEVTTSPFTIIFLLVSSKASGFMNAVVFTSAISACNHALYSGGRIAYSMSIEGYMPHYFAYINSQGIPYVLVLATWIIGGFCFASTFVGSGTLWIWIQSLVAVSNQYAWLAISLTGIRFRRGLARQKKLGHLSFQNWTYPTGPYGVLVFVCIIIFAQGWSSFAPWDSVLFLKNYIGIFLIVLIFVAWHFYTRKSFKFINYEDMDFETDRYIESEAEILENLRESSLNGWERFRRNLRVNLF